MHHSRIREKAVNRGLLAQFYEGLKKIYAEHGITKECVVANIDESEVPQNVTVRKAIARKPVYAKVSDVRVHVSAVPLVFASGDRGATCYLLTGNPDKEVPPEYLIGAGPRDVAFFAPKGYHRRV